MEERRKELKDKVTKHLSDLTNEQLKIITQWIEGDKNNDKEGTKN